MEDSEATTTDDIFSLGRGGAQPERQALSRGELLARVSALMQSCEGCDKVSVVGVTLLDRPDTAGCNWSYTLALDTAGVPAEVYGLAYAHVIAMARSSWNLAVGPDEIRGQSPKPDASWNRFGALTPMQIWVDADACPAVIKDILYRAAERKKISMTLVANKPLRTPPSPYIRALQVPRGIDVADSHIVRELAAGDLVITADIPMAADVIAKGGHALNPRGEFYSPENIQERLALRNYLDELRGTGERTGGPAALDNTDRKRFADELDRFLARHKPYSRS